MAPAPSDRPRLRSAQIRRRRAGALAVSVIAALGVIAAVGLFSGWFSSSTHATATHTQAPAPVVPPRRRRPP